MQAREKVGQWRFTAFFQWFVAPEGLAKAAVRSHLARWGMKNCTPFFWREAHLEIQMYKTHHSRTTFGSWDVEKVHAVVARSTLPSQNVESASRSEHFWKLRCRKSARHCGAKHICKSKCTKHALVARSTFRSQKCKNLWGYGAFLDVQIVVLRGRRKGLCTLSKVSKTWGFCSISKNDGRRGTFDEDLQRWISRGRRSTRDMFIRAVRRSGRWFPEKGCILEHQIFILRDRCSTSYDPLSFFRGRRSSLDGRSRKFQNALVRGCQLCTQLSIFEGSLAESFRFWCCQLKKMKNSCRSALFLMLSSAQIEEVSQNCCVFDVVKFKNWGSLAE